MQTRLSKQNWLVLAILALITSKVMIASLVPLALDEAYYLAWSHKLAWGYLDHPPLSAWLAWFGQKSMSPFANRVAAIMIGLMFISLSLRLIKRCRFDQNICTKSFLLLNFSVIGLVFSLMITPDLFLIFAWTLAINELIAATSQQRWRWLSLGAIVGIGFLSKYTMALFLFVIAWVVFRHYRPLLRCRWPYLGAIVAVIIVLPHLVWNMKNDLATLEFVTKRGFTGTHISGTSEVSQLPELRPPTPEDPEYQIVSYLHAVAPSEEIHRPPRKRLRADELTRHFRNYVGSQIAVWGSQALVIILALCLFRRGQRALIKEVKPNARNVLLPATFIPLLLFAVISLFSKVEGNWGPMYAISASLLIAPFIVHHRLLIACSILNLAAAWILTWHVNSPLPSHILKEDRLIRETRGYLELATHVRSYGNSPVFASNYQLTAMLNHYDRELSVQQYPNLSRPSEFTRNPYFWFHDDQHWDQRQGLSLVSEGPFIPVIEGFRVQQLWQLRVCRTGEVHLVHASPDLSDLPCPKQTISRINIANYYIIDSR